MKRAVLLSLSLMCLMCMSYTASAINLSCVEIYTSESNIYPPSGSLSEKFNMTFRLGNSIDGDLKHFLDTVGEERERLDYWSYNSEDNYDLPDTRLIHAKSTSGDGTTVIIPERLPFNPIIKLAIQGGAKDLETVTKMMSRETWEQFGVNSIEPEYLFIVYAKQFYKHLLAGTVYQQAALDTDGTSLVEFIDSSYQRDIEYGVDVSKEKERLLFNKNYTISQYAQDTWKWIISKSVFSERFPSYQIPCIDPNVLNFIATFTLMSKREINTQEVSEEEIARFKEELGNSLISMYKKLDYLNKYYAIFFLGSHYDVRDDKFFDVAQRVRDYMSDFSGTFENCDTYSDALSRVHQLQDMAETYFESENPERRFFITAVSSLHIGSKFAKYNYQSMMNPRYAAEGYADPFRY